MRSTLKEIMEVLPDYEQFMELVEEIGTLSLDKLLIEKELRRLEANVVTEIYTNPKFQIGGKIPSMGYIESTMKFTGFDGELLPLRERYAEVSATLDKLKLKLRVFENMTEMFRTVSANERRSTQ